jgi:NitT/TauT family transport system permease protein
LLWFGLGAPSLIFVLVHAVTWPLALVFAGLIVVIILGLVIENVVFRTIEAHTVRRWGMQR